MTPNKERAVRALLTAHTKAEAAQAAGISPRTLRAYLSDPEFMVRYQEAFRNLLDDCTREAQRSISPALGVLREISSDTKTPAAVRVQAAKSLIDFGIRFTYQIDTLHRIDELEKIVLDMEKFGGR